MVASLQEAYRIIDQKDLQVKELTKKLHSTERQLKMLQHQVEQLLKRLYGRRSEKLDPNQLMFDNLVLESLAQPAPQRPPELLVKEDSERKKPRSVKRRHPGRIRCGGKSLF